MYPGNPFIVLALFCFLGADLVPASDPAAASSRTIRVDRRGGADFATLSQAASRLQPGDTLQIAPGSGPYRETLQINCSGREDAPVIVDGGGELVTGFEPLTSFHQEGDQWVCDLPVPFPCVLTYRGERLRQDAKTAQFTKYATLSPDGKRIILKNDATPDGWEISTRDAAVRIQNVSHHVYRNIRASGCLNDGFNLHGSGEGLLFENIEAFQNLDEGFSAHDQISCEIRHGNFWDNDNGIGNVPSSRISVIHALVHDNLGWGVWFSRETTATLSDVKSWGNGMSQYRFDSASAISGDNLLAGDVPPTRQWLSYKESQDMDQPRAVQIDRSRYSGPPPKICPPEAFPNAAPEQGPVSAPR
ncbi:MAG: right-handed parallel beta-helix repeat-containing protein [Terrimicrobiaceae bacterium]